MDSLSAKRFGSFDVVKLIEKNAVKANLPPQINIRPVIHVINTTPYLEQPNHISQSFILGPNLIMTVHGEDHVFETISDHRGKGRAYQILTLKMKAPERDAGWQPFHDFVDRDGIVTKI